MIAVALLALQMVRCRCSRVRTIADDYMPHSFEGRPHIALAPVMLPTLLNGLQRIAYAIAQGRRFKAAGVQQRRS
jgi:hypothetical protein